jgi:hypothetical protein
MYAFLSFKKIAACRSVAGKRRYAVVGFKQELDGKPVRADSSGLHYQAVNQRDADR